MTQWDDLPAFPDSFSSAEPPPADQPAPPPQPDQPFTAHQQVRLENEWRRLQRSFAYHPHVRVIPLKGDPPEEYQVEYRLKTLVMDADGQLEYTTTGAVHVWIPPNFPHEPPLIRPISALFHPNIIADGINIDRAWTGPTSTLADAIRAVGAMVAFQDYDVDAVWNPTAMEWIRQNPRYVPVDFEANLAFDAGGEPLARIIRYGPRTLEQVRTQLKQTCDLLISPEDAPAADEVVQNAARTRQVLSLFTEDDVPEEIRAPASELDEWARFLPGSIALWEKIREYRAASGAAMTLSQQLRDVERSILHELSGVDSMVQAKPGATLGETLRLLPTPSMLHLHQGNLDNLLLRSSQLLEQTRKAQARLSSLPGLHPLDGLGLLQKRLEAESGRAQGLSVEANDKLLAALTRIEPVVARANMQAAGMRRMTQWREYGEMVSKAEALSRKLGDWGAGGLQAHYVENESGRFGPYELEQAIELGALKLAVRNAASQIIEVVDALTGKLLQRGEEGSALLDVPEQDGTSHRTVFRLSGNCDEVAVQLDYLGREATRLIESIKNPIATPDGWMRQFHEVLEAWVTSGRVLIDHEALARRWRALREDVLSLRPFKERLATLRLLQRMGESVPALRTRLAEARKVLQASTDRISQIVAGSNTDLETGRLLIPQKFAREYPEQLQRRDQAKLDVETTLAQLQSAGEEIQRRVLQPELLGFAEAPALTMLGGVPETWAHIEAQMADDEITRRLDELEGLLGTPLKPPPVAGTPSAAEHEQPPETGEST